MVYRLLVPFLAVLLFSNLNAQRRIATLDPNVDVPEEEIVTFDTNIVPVAGTTVEVASVGSLANSRTLVDLNFSPNIVFIPGTSRAFVPYTGSNQVMYFDAVTHEILAMIEVEENPSQLTLSPDGKTIGFTSLYLKRNIPDPSNSFDSEQVGAVTFIDVETLAARTLALTEVGLSVANNLIFSGDSKTAYVASALTDEILRIDVEALAEISPRLALSGGSRPISISMAPDFSFFTVVQVGSAQLEFSQSPDSVSLIDPETWTVTHTISPKTGSNTDEPLFHDFAAATSVVFSADGRYGLIVDQRNSEVSSIPELASDRAWLIDFEIPDFVNVFRTGGISAMTTLSPTGEFVVVSAFELTMIDPETQTFRKITPNRSNFRPRSRVLFNADGSKIFIAAPMDDIVMRVDNEFGTVDRFVTVGGEVDRSGRKLSSAPLEMAFSPVGEILAVVNYNANTIDLVIPSYQRYVTRSVSSDEFYTGVAFTNRGTEEADVVVTGLTTGGILFQDDDETEEIEFVNPRHGLVAPGRQVALTTDELFEASEGSRADGWVDIDTDRNDLRGFFLSGDYAGKRMDGAVAATVGYNRLIIPEVRSTDGWQTELTVSNISRG
ncbi:MAG: hypothetical protein JSU96_02650, partial [Acidobacteriota bacterium]